MRDPKFFTRSRTALGIIWICLILWGCHPTAIKQSLSPHISAAQTYYPKTYYPIEFKSFDGTLLRATLFQPELNAHQTAPVIIQLHAFAVSRVKKPKSFMGNWFFSGETALKLWQQGYWVVSLDLRGHGDSEGNINLADPQQEIRDISALIDWLTQNLPAITTLHQDPVIGIIGDSYGAGVALLASTQDKRIDAIVSANGWYDLAEGLSPDQIPKIGWLTTPLFTGHIFNPGRMNLFFNNFYQDAVHNNIHHQYDALLQERSVKYFCEHQQPIQADTLIIQGLRDILFDFNQGLGIQDCLHQAQRDNRLLGIYNGHLQPFLQWNGSNTFYYVEKQLHCDQSSINLQTAAKDWFDFKLKNDTNAGLRVPKLCLSTSANTGALINNLPANDKKVELKSPWLSSPVGRHITPKAIVSYINKPWSQPLKPLTYLLTPITQSGNWVGTPRVRLHSKAANIPDLNLFIGIAILENHKLTLINDQVTAIKSRSLNQPRTITLNTLATRIHAGQTLVGVIYAYQHRLGVRGNWWESLQLEGEIFIPMPLKPTDNQPLGQF